MTENGRRVRVVGGGGAVRKLTRLWVCDLVVYLMYKGTCLTLLWRNLSYLHFFMPCSHLISMGYCVVRSQFPVTGEEKQNSDGRNAYTLPHLLY